MKLLPATLVALALLSVPFLVSQPALADEEIADNPDCILVAERTYSVRGDPFERVITESWPVICLGPPMTIFDEWVTNTQRIVRVEDRQQRDYAVIQPDGSEVPCSTTDVLLGTHEEIVSEFREYPELPDAIEECMGEGGACCYQDLTHTFTTSTTGNPLVSVRTHQFPCPDESFIRVVITTTVTNETIDTYRRTIKRPTGACPDDPCLTTTELRGTETREVSRYETLSYPDGPCGTP